MQDVGKVEVLAVERGWRGRRLLHVLVLWRLLLLLLTLLLVLLLSLASKAGKVSQHRDGKARGAGDVEEVVRSKVSKLYRSLVLKDATFVRGHHDQTNNITVTGVTPRLMSLSCSVLVAAHVLLDVLDVHVALVCEDDEQKIPTNDEGPAGRPRRRFA